MITELQSLNEPGGVVWVSSDSEGNEYSQVADVALMMVHEGHPVTEEDCDDMEIDLPKTKGVFLWPE